MENDRSVRTSIAVLLIVAAVMIITGNVITGAGVSDWWLPFVLLVVAGVMALPINLWSRAMAGLPASPVVTPRVGRTADDPRPHPTPDEIREQTRYAPTPGAPLENPPAGAKDPPPAAAPKMPDNRETTAPPTGLGGVEAAAADVPPEGEDSNDTQHAQGVNTPHQPAGIGVQATNTAPAMLTPPMQEGYPTPITAEHAQPKRILPDDEHVHPLKPEPVPPEIPTIGIDNAEAQTQPESTDAESRVRSVEVPSMPNAASRDPDLMDEPGYQRQTTADQGFGASSGDIPLATVPDRPAAKGSDSKRQRKVAPDASKEPADTSAPIAPQSGGAITVEELAKISGIDARIAGILIENGVNSYEKLAGTSEEHLRGMLKKAGVRKKVDVRSWAEQAAFAAKNDWAGLEAYRKQQGKPSVM